MKHGQGTRQAKRTQWGSLQPVPATRAGAAGRSPPLAATAPCPGTCRLIERMQRLDPRARILVGSFIAVFALAMVTPALPTLAEEDLFDGDSKSASLFVCA